MATSHPFQLGLYPTPVALHILCVYTCGRVDECDRVVHSSVTGNIREILNIPVCCPFIRVNNCAWSCVGVDDRQ